MGDWDAVKSAAKSIEEEVEKLIGAGHQIPVLHQASKDLNDAAGLNEERALDESIDKGVAQAEAGELQERPGVTEEAPLDPSPVADPTFPPPGETAGSSTTGSSTTSAPENPAMTNPPSS